MSANDVLKAIKLYKERGGEIYDMDSAIEELKTIFGAPELDPIADELGKWRRMATKRYKEGAPEKMTDFTTDVLPATLHSAIVGALSACEDYGAVKQVFDDADGWLSHA